MDKYLNTSKFVVFNFQFSPFKTNIDRNILGLLGACNIYDVT